MKVELLFAKYLVGHHLRKQEANLKGITKDLIKKLIRKESIENLEKTNKILRFIIIMKTRNNRNLKNKTKKFLYNPNNPKKSFDVYIDKNPNDTIPIKYTTLNDVKNTIKKLERLYKNKKYTHKRIWQVGMIMKVRLEVLKDIKPQQYKLSERYFKFLGERTKINNDDRYKFNFKI